MLPEFDAFGNLPPGVHRATWDELVERFGGNAHRQALLAGLRRALTALQAAGCETAYVNGSFVTAREDPGDYDLCWDVGDRVDPKLLDPVLLPGRRREAKEKYLGDILPNMPMNPTGPTVLQFFQQDEDGRLKGIVAISLSNL